MTIKSCRCGRACGRSGGGGGSRGRGDSRGAWSGTPQLSRAAASRRIWTSQKPPKTPDPRQMIPFDEHIFQMG